MLDIKFIIENKARVAEAIKNKGVDLNLNDLLTVQARRAEIQQKIEELNRQKNANAARMKGQVGKPPEGLISEGRKIKEEVEKLNPQFEKLDEKYRELMLKVPNVCSEDTPIGPDDSANQDLQHIGQPPKFDFEPHSHIELGQKLNILDIVNHQ